MAFTAWQQYTVAAEFTKKMEVYFPNAGVDETESGGTNRKGANDKLTNRLRAWWPWGQITSQDNEVELEVRLDLIRYPCQRVMIWSDNEDRVSNHRNMIQIPSQQTNPGIMADNINGLLSIAISRPWVGSQYE